MVSMTCPKMNNMHVSPYKYLFFVFNPLAALTLVKTPKEYAMIKQLTN